MNRPLIHQTLMGIAELLAEERATCSRAQVGAVIAREGRIISSGYNGTPSGMKHCQHETKHDVDCAQRQYRTYRFNGETYFSKCDCVVSYPCKDSVHAERNAVYFAARHGHATLGADMYCTHSPCVDCAQAIIQAGIATVYYQELYGSQGLELLQAAGVQHTMWRNE
jgi:dCMP deaminase